MITPEQRSEALEASIEKWKRNAVAKTPKEYTVSAGSCPLCALYFFGDNGSLNEAERCRGCPIHEKTGLIDCQGTPYIAAFNARWVWFDGGSRLAADRARSKALEMVSFLETCRESDHG